MDFREAIREIDGMRFVSELLELHSGPGRRALAALEMLTDPAAIEKRLEKTGTACEALRQPTLKGKFSRLMVRLGQGGDISGIVRRLTEGCTGDEVELFEIKAFCLNAREVAALAGETGLGGVAEFPENEAVIDILDPDGSGVPHFRLYDAYSPELAAIRREIKEFSGNHGEIPERLVEKLKGEELKVRQELTKRLAPHLPRLEKTVRAMAELDITLAKAGMALQYGFIRPTVSPEFRTRYQGLFNPDVKNKVEDSGGHYQPVDVDFEKGVTVITGANMGGKTVLLKTIALSQALFQFGFFVPAAQAAIFPVGKILICFGEGQDHSRGLSSFAGQILRLDSIIKETDDGSRALVLVDEPARTTNPAEGRAIVDALAEVLREAEAAVFITTHYSSAGAGCRRLRVKGFGEAMADGPLTPGNIQDFMDYSLVPDTDGTAPRDALRIASLLGVDGRLIERAAAHMKDNEDKK